MRKIIINLIFLLVFVGEVYSAVPQITECWNNQTRDNTINITVELGALIVFRAIADQDIQYSNWEWSVNGSTKTLVVPRYGPYSVKDSTYRIWAEQGGATYTVEVKGANDNGTSNTIRWTINVLGNTADKITVNYYADREWPEQTDYSIINYNMGRDSPWNGFTFPGTRYGVAMNHVVQGSYHNGMQLSNWYLTRTGYENRFKNTEVFNTQDNAYYLTGEVGEETYNLILEDCVAHDINSRGVAMNVVLAATIRRLTTWNLRGQDIDFYRARKCYVIDCELNKSDPSLCSIRANGENADTENANENNVINTKFNGSIESYEGDITFWSYLDVLVVDINENPVEGAKVTVSHPDVSINWYGDGTQYTNLEVKAINLHVLPRDYTEGLLAPQKISSTTTGINGHTPLPVESDITLVLADWRLDAHGQPWYQHPAQTTQFKDWTITAEKNGFTASATVDPDDSWYRKNPNSYPGIGKGTALIKLPGIINIQPPPEDKSKEQNIAVYPNPYIAGKSKTNIISFSGLDNDAVLGIYEISGALVENIVTKNGKAEWEVSNISGGIYLYVLTSPGGVKKGKISLVK